VPRILNLESGAPAPRVKKEGAGTIPARRLLDYVRLARSESQIGRRNGQSSERNEKLCIAVAEPLKPGIGPVCFQ
jgi:hypothetical protein